MNLHQLVADHCVISDNGIKYMKYLRILSINLNPHITDNGIKYMKSLRILRACCRHSSITNNGLKELYLHTLCAVDNPNIMEECYNHMNLQLFYFQVLVYMKSSMHSLIWIPTNNFLNSDINTCLIGVASIKGDSNTCESIIFINKSNYETFSQLFSYTLKNNKVFHPNNTIGPKYYATQLNKYEFWGSSKINNYIVLGIYNNTSIENYTWNPITNNICKVTFEEPIEKPKKDNCNDVNCDCKDINKLRHEWGLHKKYKPTINTPSFSDTLMVIINKFKKCNCCCININNISNVCIIESSKLIVYGFRSSRRSIFVTIPYTIDSTKSNKIILKRFATIICYNMNNEQLVDFVYDDKKSRMLILTKHKNGSIWEIKFSKVFKSLKYTAKKIINLNYKPSTFCFTSLNNLLIVDRTKKNKFRVDIKKID